MLSRVLLLACALALFTGGCSNSRVSAVDHDDDPHAFGAIADCQYCGLAGEGVRKYALSEQKLSECVAALNQLDLAYTIHLGDFIDRDWASFDVVSPIFAALAMPHYHVLGNHDFSVADEHKHAVPARLNMPGRYYQFTVKQWRYLVLDGNDISFHAHPEGSPEWQAAERYYTDNLIDSPRWNGAIGAEQLRWLEAQLQQAQQQDEQVICYCHFPVYPADKHNLWNADEVIAVIERFPCVKGWINGHNHAGNYAMKNGVHYLTLKGMVDTEETAWAVITVDDDTIAVTGHGREEDRVLPIAREP